jgi:ABC-type multidrug transport system fused ATPase/permease subunit
MSFGRVLIVEWLRWPLLLAGFLGMIASGLSYAGPIFIKHIMFFIKDTTPTKAEQRRAFLYASFWLIMYFLRIFVNMQAQWLCFQSSIRAEQIIHLTVYDKMMHMSYSYRRLMQEGDFMALFSIDTKIIVAFIKVFSVLFSAPTTLITSQIFLYA